MFQALGWWHPITGRTHCGTASHCPPIEQPGELHGPSARHRLAIDPVNGKRSDHLRRKWVPHCTTESLNDVYISRRTHTPLHSAQCLLGWDELWINYSLTGSFSAQINTSLSCSWSPKWLSCKFLSVRQSAQMYT